MPFIETNGATVSYEVVGAGPAVLLGHSLLVDRQMWRAIVPRLADRYRVVNVEARGHGQSTAERPFDFDDLVSDWLAILDREGIERAALCGLSMGGMTAMRLALARPERVSSLLLLNTSAGAERLLNRARYAAMAAVYRQLGVISPLERPILELMLGRTTLREQPALADEFLATVKRHDKAQLARAIRAVASRRSIAHRLSEIRHPTLIVVGEEDRATPPSCSRAIQAAIPSSRLELLPTSGHLSALERPEEVAALLEEHLSGTATGSA